jgi:hypothetical protein
LHRATERFWKCFDHLPALVQKTAENNFELLKANPSHPSLHFKKVGTFWSVRADLLADAEYAEFGFSFQCNGPRA